MKAVRPTLAPFKGGKKQKQGLVVFGSWKNGREGKRGKKNRENLY